MRTLLGRRGILAAGATLTAAVWARNSLRAQEMQPLSGIAKVAPPGVLPDLEFATLDGGRVMLSSFRGKPVVLNFWATWCAPCVAELPDLDRLAAGGVVVVAASTDHAGMEVVKPFLARHGISHADVVLDPGNTSTHAAGVVGFPTTLIIDAQGRLRGRLEGPADWSGAAGVVASLTA
jgi:thiol-disulfide isomerase/thioredoxin